MVVGLFVYQQLFGFQIKIFRFPYLMPTQAVLFATWPSDLLS